MLKFRNYNIANDFLVKIPKNHPYNKPTLNSIKVTLSNNSVAQNPKLLIPLINLNLSLLGQYPQIIDAKKSVASFKLRKDSPVGLKTTLRGPRFESFLNLLNYYYLPRVASNKTFKFASRPSAVPAWSLATQHTKSSYPGFGAGSRIINKVGYNTLSFGFNSTVVLSYLTPLDESLFMHLTSTSASQELLSNKTGGYIQMTHHYNPPASFNTSREATPTSRDIPHKFFISLLYIPIAL